jgi:hypothetical protein
LPPASSFASLKSSLYAEQITYTVNVLDAFQVTVHPVAGVKVVPPSGADTRDSTLLPVRVVVAKPPPVANG